MIFHPQNPPVTLILKIIAKDRRTSIGRGNMCVCVSVCVREREKERERERERERESHFPNAEKRLSKMLLGISDFFSFLRKR